MRQKQYKVGDRVTIIGNLAGHGYPPGSVHTIVTVDSDENGAQLQLDNGHGKWADKDDVEHTPSRTLKRSDIIKLIMLGQSDGLVNRTGIEQQRQRAIQIFENYET